MTEKTLVILTPGFPKDERDSTCIPFIQSFIKTVNKLHPELKLVVISFYYPFTKKTYEWFGNRIIPFDGNQYWKISRPLYWLKIYRYLKKIKKTQNVIGLLSFWLGQTAFIGHHFAKRNGLKHFCWLGGQDAKRGNPVMSYFKPEANSLIAISPFQKKIFSNSYGIIPKYVIPNALAEEEFHHIVQGEKDIDIIGVGSLIPLKRYELFIEVIDQLKKYLPSIKAMIVGDGTQRRYLETLIIEKGLTQNICLKGEMTHSNTLQLIQRAKILLHPSEYEGYSRVCLEALYLGCQVVSFVDCEQKQVPNWHIVNSTNEMIDKCNDLLSVKESEYVPVKVHMMRDCVNRILKLYNYFEADRISFTDLELREKAQ